MDGVTKVLWNQGVYADIVLSRRVDKDVFGSDEEGAENGLHIVKVVQAPRDGIDHSRLPHNILLEVEILKQIHHPHVIELLNYQYDTASSVHSVSLPLLAFTLGALLSESLSDQNLGIIFPHIARQALAGLAYLHAQGIAHRDINPKNIMFDWSGVLVFIDFSTAYAPQIYTTGEDEQHMVCQVGTGPYRAPELLFGVEKYDAPSIDIWAIGTVLAEFFLPQTDTIDIIDDFGPLEMDSFRTGVNRRGTLYDATFGDIGVAASIFRVRGSPRYSWPEFDTLPDSDKVIVDDMPPRPIYQVLPRLQAIQEGHQVEDLLDRLMALSPSRRLSADAALRLPYFTDSPSTIELGQESTIPSPPSIVEVLEPHLTTARKRIRNVTS